MKDVSQLQAARNEAAGHANAEDAALWRWFSGLCDERRIRWCESERGWLVTLDHRHLATAETFDNAIRVAKSKASVTL